MKTSLKDKTKAFIHSASKEWNEFAVAYMAMHSREISGRDK